MMRRTAQHGFTLVEMMVATVIAMASTLAICQCFAIAEGYRRTSTSGGDAQFAGAIAAYVLASDLRGSGYGINTPAYLGCAATAHDNVQAKDIPFTLAPVVITPGASAANPDTVLVLGGNSAALSGPTSLSTAMTAATDNYQVVNPYGIYSGDLLVLAQAGSACTMAQATVTPTTAAVGSQYVVTHTSGVSSSNRYNKSGGLGPAYSNSAVLMDLGTPANVIFNKYYVAGRTLNVQNLLTGAVQPVAANIVQFKAFYGMGTAGDGTIDSWTSAAPGAGAWSNVLAVKFAIVAQSQNPEKPGSTGTCSTTTAYPVVTWDDGSAATTMDLSATPNWMCYRYRTFHMTVTLLNQIWTPS